jgi:hypothetical protein
MEARQEVMRLLPKEERKIAESWERWSPIVIVKTDIFFQGKMVDTGEKKVFFLPSFWVFSALALGVFVGGVRSILKRRTGKPMLH